MRWKIGELGHLSRISLWCPNMPLVIIEQNKTFFIVKAWLTMCALSKKPNWKAIWDNDVRFAEYNRFQRFDRLLQHKCPNQNRTIDCTHKHARYLAVQTDGLVQERRNSIANALELRLSCTNPTRCLIKHAFSFVMLCFVVVPLWVPSGFVWFI